MSSIGDSIAALAKVVGALLRGPGRFLLGVAAVVLAVALALAVVVATSPGGPGTAGTIALVGLPVLLAVPVVVLAVRRARWLRATTDDGGRRVIVAGSPGEVLTPDALVHRVESDMRGRPGEEDVRLVFDAFTEAQRPPSAGGRLTRLLGVGRLGMVGRALGRVDQAQRALLTAAGGPVAAPYLKDDLRVTLAAFLGVLVAIPLGALTAIVLALVLLSR